MFLYFLTPNPLKGGFKKTFISFGFYSGFISFRVTFANLLFLNLFFSHYEQKKASALRDLLFSHLFFLKDTIVSVSGPVGRNKKNNIQKRKPTVSL